ncbi:MAG: oligosaccharide flippase family protein [Flavobacterium sp.]|nr:oligosaccharide flippase family protein [Flavobacterium sp.]
MSQLKKGAILSYVTIILTNVLGLLITPFMIHKLGKQEYGLYTLIGSLVGYISVLDLGLNNTIIRFLAKYRAQNDRKAEENFLATTFIIYCIISLLIVIIGIVIFYNLDNIFYKLSASDLYKAKIMFAILIFNLAITLPGGTFSAIYSGYEQFVFPRMLNIIKYIVRSITLVLILSLGAQSIGMVILDTILNLSIIAINVFYVFTHLKVKFKLYNFKWSYIREIFSYSVWIFVYAIVAQLQWTSGQLILGRISTTTIIAIYGVGILLGTYYAAFSAAIAEVFLPRATKMTVLNATGEELTDMMIRIGRFSLIMLLFVLGGFLVFGQQFINLWVGNSFADSWTIAIIIMITYTFPLSQLFAHSILEAKGKFYFKALVYISLITVGTAFGTYLFRFFGVIGLITGSTSGWIISQIIMNFYYHKKIGLNIPRFFNGLLHNLFLTFLTILAIAFLINLIPGNNWLNLFSKLVIYAFVYIIIMSKFGINQLEMDIFVDLIPKFITKRFKVFKI